MKIDGHQVVAFGVPVEQHGVARAVVLAFADIRQWPLQGYNRQLVIGKQATPYVVDPRGTVAAAGDPGAVGAVLPVARRTHVTSTRLHGRPVTLSTSSASRGWSAVTVQDATAWSSDLAATRERAGVALAALLTAVLGLLLWAFHRAHTTQRRLAEQRLHDPLTGLGQRVMFEHHLNAAFARRRRTQTAVGLLYCDLDGFKQINDKYGHNVGDRLLENVGARIKDTIRSDDLAVRLGGDEFAVVAEGLEGDALDQLARRISDAVEQPVTIGRTVLTPRISIGTATATDDDAQTLIHTADLAMYAAKAARATDRHSTTAASSHASHRLPGQRHHGDVPAEP
jgi:diguanylate cyclase (GGDEF)-like protein